MKNIMKTQFWTFLILFLYTMPARGENPIEHQWTLRPANIALRSGERIVAFSLKFKSATVCSVATVPKNWSFSVDNSLDESPPWTTTVDGTTGVASASLSPVFFNDFIRFEKSAKPVSKPFGAQLTIFASQDFATDREIVVPMSKLIISPVIKNDHDNSSKGSNR